MNYSKVLVAMSGGVDSSVAAVLLKEQGYNLIGATMVLYCSTKSSSKSCCSMNAAADAKKVADRIGILHYTLNFKAEFKKYVIDNFIEEYKSGRTPNPCIRCNQFIKFDLLLRKAKELGAEYIATGHYAKIMTNEKCLMTNEGVPAAHYKLLKGKDGEKDQSYVLYRMNQESLGHTLFPIGEMTKEDVRKAARKLKLPVADKKESQEICFVEDDAYIRFLKEKCPETVRPGPIIDKTGKVIGRHEGIAFYTIGQRKGIGAHRGKPKYVIEINQKNNVIVIGDDEDTLRKELVAKDVSFVSGEIPVEPIEVTVKIRYNAPEASAMLYPKHREQNTEHRAQVRFKHPQRAITPGQSVVFYQGDEVIGGGIIS